MTKVLSNKIRQPNDSTWVLDENDIEITRIIFKNVIYWYGKTSEKDGIIKNIQRVLVLVKKEYINNYLDHFRDCALWIR